MFNESNFIVRVSGRRENSYYIDYSGIFKITEIAKITGVEAPAIREKYLANGAIYDEDQDVYYFSSLESAQKAVGDVLKNMKPEQKGKIVYLTEAEIEYIRKALINEASNTLHISTRVKDAIFKKLNA